MSAVDLISRNIGWLQEDIKRNGEILQGISELLTENNDLIRDVIDIGLMLMPPGRLEQYKIAKAGQVLLTVRGMYAGAKFTLDGSLEYAEILGVPALSTLLVKHGSIWLKENVSFVAETPVGSLSRYKEAEDDA